MTEKNLVQVMNPSNFSPEIKPLLTFSLNSRNCAMKERSLTKTFVLSTFAVTLAVSVSKNKYNKKQLVNKKFS